MQVIVFQSQAIVFHSCSLVSAGHTFEGMIPNETTQAWSMTEAGWGFRELAVPGWGEALVRTRTSLLLSSDIASLRRGEIPTLRAQVADVMSVGEECSVHPGTRIFPAWRASCGLCEACQRGNETLCLDWANSGMAPQGPASHLLLPAWNVRRASVGLSVAEPPEGQVFLQPLATVLRALRRANPAFPLRVAVWGSGPMARLWGMVLELRHPGVRRGLLSPCEETGFLGHGFHAHGQEPEELVARLEGRPDLAILIDPPAERVVEAFELVCSGGIVVMTGEPEGDVSLGLHRFHREEKRLVSCFDAGPRDFKSAVTVMQPLMERLASLAPASLRLPSGGTLPEPGALVPFLRIDWTEPTEEKELYRLDG